MSKIHFIFIAGGKGERMKSATPKQFLRVNNIPIWVLTFNQIQNCVPDAEFTFVAPKEYFGLWMKQKEEFIDPAVNINLVAGGPRRYYSVKNALPFVKSDQIVAIHDAVRPFVSKKTILDGIRLSSLFGNAVPSIPINESIRYTEGAISKTVNRDDYKIIQTPQFFQADIIKKAYTLQYSLEFTDDASVAEASGINIKLFNGNKENIKITEPFDLLVAQTLSSNNI